MADEQSRQQWDRAAMQIANLRAAMGERNVDWREYHPHYREQLRKEGRAAFAAMAREQVKRQRERANDSRQN